MLLPVGQSILARAAGPQRMGRVMSIIGVPMVLGPDHGPGHRRAHRLELQLALDLLHQPADRHRHARSSRAGGCPSGTPTSASPRPSTRSGFCLLSPGLAALVYSLAEVGTTGSFTSHVGRRSASSSGVVLMVGFILHALHIKNPLLELHLFKDRNFTIANICIFVLGATLFGSMFLLPLYYQIARGQEAWVAGLLMAPQGIGAACIMRWAGSMTDRVGPRRIVPFGILLMAAATIPFAFVTTSTSEVLLAVHALRPRPRPRPDDDARHRRGLLRPQPRRDPQGQHDHEHRAPGRRLGGHRPVRRRAGAPDRDASSARPRPRPAAAPASSRRPATLPPQVADPVAAAFAHTFWWAVGAILIAFIPTLFLPNHAARAVPSHEDGGIGAEGDSAGGENGDGHGDSDDGDGPGRRGHARLTHATRSPPGRTGGDSCPGPAASRRRRRPRELVDCAGGDLVLAARAGRPATAPGNPWPGSPAGPPSATSRRASTPVSTSLAGRAWSWPGAPPPACPTAATPSTCAPGRARSPPRSAPRGRQRTDRGDGQRRARRRLRPGQRGRDLPRALTSSPPCRRRSGGRPTSSSRWCPTSRPPNCTCSPATRSRSRTPPTTTAAGTAPFCCGVSSPRPRLPAPGRRRPAGARRRPGRRAPPSARASSGTTTCGPGPTRTETCAGWRRRSADKADVPGALSDGRRPRPRTTGPPRASGGRGRG